MKLLCIPLLFVIASIAWAQSSIPPYHAYNDFLLASPGALKFGLYGFDNPALLTSVRQPDILVAWSDGAATNRWGLFGAASHIAFGMIHERTSAGSVTDYRTSSAVGNRSFGIGMSYGWSSGDEAIFNRTSLIALGMLIRPNHYVSVGLSGTKSVNVSDNQGVADVAFRPLGNELATLFADFAIQRGQSLNNGNWSAGAAVEPLAGIRLTARYFDSKAFTVGAELSLGNAGVSAQNHQSGTSGSSYNTYAVRIGAYDRNIFKPAFNAGKNYVEMGLLGPVGYQRYQLFDNTKTLTSLLETIDAAKNDRSVAGIAINTSGLVTDREKLWELREKLKDFKTTGKRVIVFIDRGGIDLYHFASVADRVVMDSEGMLSLEGYAMGRTYLKGTLEKLGIGFDEWRYFKYKSANESLSRDNMSDADREQRQKLVDNYYSLAKDDICEAREISPERFDKLVNEEFLFLPRQALQQGLVDTLGRWETVKEMIRKVEGEEKRYVHADALERFQAPVDNRWGEPPRIAVIYAIGVCDMDAGIRARSLVKDVQGAIDDPGVKAIVLRVDSPGGDAMASDYIAAPLKKAKGKKPIIVSQGFVAASGGYWLSMCADTIVAAPTTITGSIGVAGGWIYNKGLKEAMGFSTDLVKVGSHADLAFGFTMPFIGLGIPDRNLTTEERARSEQWMKALYKEFVEKVASGRNVKPDQIEPIAQGRVWSGIDGKQHGLVDVMGGLETAVRIAKEKAGIGREEEVTLVELPRKGLFDFSKLLPRFIGVETAPPKDEVLEWIKFRLKHNGEPMPILPMEEMESKME